MHHAEKRDPRASLRGDRGLDIYRTRTRPGEAAAILIIYPDAALNSAVARERLEPVTWRYSKIAHGSSGSEIRQLASCDRNEVHRKNLPRGGGVRSVVDVLGAARSALHDTSVTYNVTRRDSPLRSPWILPTRSRYRASWGKRPRFRDYGAA